MAYSNQSGSGIEIKVNGCEFNFHSGHGCFETSLGNFVCLTDTVFAYYTLDLVRLSDETLIKPSIGPFYLLATGMAMSGAVTHPPRKSLVDWHPVFILLRYTGSTIKRDHPVMRTVQAPES